MKTIAVLTAVLLLTLTTNAGPPDGCDDWSIHGYWIGMSFDEAEQVRPIKRKSNGQLVVKEKGQYKGYLTFDYDGLIRYGADFNSGALGQKGSPQHAQAATILKERFGEPFDTMRTESWNAMTGNTKVVAPYWFSEECDSLIAVQSITAGDSIKVTQTAVILRRYSNWKASRSGTMLD